MKKIKDVWATTVNAGQAARQNGVPVIPFAILAVVFLGLGWVVFGFLFTLGFLLLTATYAITAFAVASLVCWWYGMTMEEVLKNNNTYFFVLCGITAITFVIALFHFGPALLLPDTTPSPETRQTVSNFLNRLWLGKSAPPTETPGPLPWTTGTWFWWKAFLLYLVLTIGYIPIAFWDEVFYAVAMTAKFIKDKTTPDPHHHPSPGQPGQPATAPVTHDTGHSFGELLKVEFIVEIVTELVKHFLAKRRTN